MAQEKTLDEVQGTATQSELPLLDLTEHDENWRAAELRAELDLIPDTEFARAVNLAPQTLAAWRSEGQGPSYVKLGKTVFYRREHIAEWVGRCVTTLPPEAA